MLWCLLSMACWVGCTSDDDETDGGGTGPTPAPTIEIEVKADEFQVKDFLPVKLVDWNFGSEFPSEPIFGDMEDTWLFGMNSKMDDNGASRLDGPTLYFGFNATGSYRYVESNVHGHDASGKYHEFRISVRQSAQTKAGKSLNITLGTLLPLKRAIDIYAPEIDFEKTPLLLDFGHGMQVRPVEAKGHVATVKIEADQPFVGDMKVHVGQDIYDFGRTRVYTYKGFPVPWYTTSNFPRPDRIDMGDARFYAYCFTDGYDNDRVGKAYDKDLNPTAIRIYDQYGKQMGRNIDFSIVRPIYEDLYYGRFYGLNLQEWTPKVTAQSVFVFDDNTKRIALANGVWHQQCPVIIRRSTGDIYEIRGLKDDDQFEYSTCVESTDEYDKLYSIVGDNRIASLKVPKKNINFDDFLNVEYLKNIETAKIDWHHCMSNNMILMNENQVWDDGYVRYVESPDGMQSSHYVPSFFSNQVFNIWFTQIERQVPSSGTVYEKILKISDVLRGINWSAKDSWYDSDWSVRGDYLTFSYMDHTLFLPMRKTENLPDSLEGYRLAPHENFAPFAVSSHFIKQYQRKGLYQIARCEPYVNKYSYWYDKEANEIYRMHIEPLQDMELLFKSPYNSLLDDAMVQSLPWGIAISDNEQNELSASSQVILIPEEGKPVVKKLTFGENAGYFYKTAL